MQTSALPQLESRAEWVLGLAINPYLISSAIAVAGVSVAATHPGDLPLWLILIAAAAGWSSAWSP